MDGERKSFEHSFHMGCYLPGSANAFFSVPWTMSACSSAGEGRAVAKAMKRVKRSALVCMLALV